MDILVVADVLTLAVIAAEDVSPSDAAVVGTAPAAGIPLVQAL